ncbi:LLM class F420-dependent oxidoreductase [Saccharopolyspora sp. CA-218241]|uniref:LLM class F420-dependent oxidoreductase n=1 Tax=Saccharopolyspora sp. CA-218241 TaxID=3240027 RepID=UPI003D95DF0E
MALGLGRIGLWIAEAFWDPGRSDHREAAAQIQELGFGTLWLGNAHGGLATAEGLLDATERLVVGTSIVNVWLYSPADVAAAYQRVDRSRPGRLLVGLGSSHAPLVEQHGHSYRKPLTKVRSYLDELDAQSVPLPHHARALAALGPRTLEVAGQRTAGALPYLVTPEHTAQARQILGRGPLLAPEQKVVLETDPDEARRIAREGVAVYLGLPNYANNLRRLGFTDADLADGGSDRLIDAVVAWGDQDAVLRRVREHFDAGAEHVAVQVLTGSDDLARQQWSELAPALL